MNFLLHLTNDISKLSSTSVRKSLKKVFLSIESAKTLSEIPNLKKISGFADAYRIRLGDYRLGFFLKNDIVQLARIANRKNIYRVFP